MRLARAAFIGMVPLVAAATASRAVAQAPGRAVSASHTLVGRVIDGATGAPIANADVSVARGTAPHATRSSTDGRWQLGVPTDGEVTIVVRALGYAPARLTPPSSPDAGAPMVVRLQAAPHSLDQMVVTAARREQRLADAVVTTEIVSRADIARTGASDLAAVLAEQTGIQFQEGHPSGAGVMLQGVGAERVLILLDGQPLVGRISGNFDLSRIPTAMVERVEVVKGPQSTLYGSEAMGGVVNIVTRDAAADQWSGSASVLGGSAGRRDASVSGALGRGDWGANIDLGTRSVDRTPGRPGSTGALAERLDASVKARWSRDTTRSFEVSGLVLSERQRWGGGTLFDFADNTQVGARLGGSFLVGAHRLTPTVYLSQFDHLARTGRTPAPIAGSGDRQVQRLAEAELLYSGRLFGQVVDAGLEVRQEYIEASDGRITGGRRTLLGAEPFAQVELAGGRWSVVPGARLTWNEQWGSYLTPRVALRWQVAEPLTLRLSAGRGFRAPDFKELYLNFTNDNAGYAVYGNGLLRPESSDNLTGGVEWNGGRGFARGQLYWNRLRDFIETRPIPTTGAIVLYEYGNVDQAMTAGVDLELGLTFGGAQVEFGYGGLRAEDRVTGQALLGRPAHSGRALVGYALPLGLRGSLTGVYTGRTPMQRDQLGAITSTRDAFLRFDARLAQRIPGGLELVLGADNLFDQRPAEWAGAVGRQFYTGVTWSFARDLP